jgi:hypothetical protein
MIKKSQKKKDQCWNAMNISLNSENSFSFNVLLIYYGLERTQACVWMRKNSIAEPMAVFGWQEINFI